MNLNSQRSSAFNHQFQPKVGILLANLGTPDAPTAKALRKYLAQFLSDRRVVEIPRLVWWCILHGIILNTRPAKSAEKYAQVWTAEGSPLMVHAKKQASLFQGFLSLKVQSPYVVKIGMSYGNPSMASAIDELMAEQCDRIIVLPMFPQYAASSTGAALDAVWRKLLGTRNMPAIRTVRHYHDHPAYINALAESVRSHWQLEGKPDKLVISFHGVPRYTLDRGDPYHCECHKTARLLAEALGLDKADYLVCFQSRFGRAEWLKPYLAPMLEQLGQQKLRRVDVICPGFSADCLETLEEIAMEGKHLFQSNGGGEYHYIPALNEREAWIHAMVQIVLENGQGWLEASFDEQAAQQTAARTAMLAKAMQLDQEAGK